VRCEKKLSTHLNMDLELDSGGTLCGENCFYAIKTYTCLLCVIEKYMFSSMPLVLIFSFLAAIAVRSVKNFRYYHLLGSLRVTSMPISLQAILLLRRKKNYIASRGPLVSHSHSTLLLCATALPPSNVVCCCISLAGSCAARQRTPTHHTLRLAARSVETLIE
jgi:hypothetical protein